MMKKLKFVSPRMTQMVELSPEFDILGDSIETGAAIISMGQEEQNYDFSGETNSSSGYSVYWD